MRRSLTLCFLLVATTASAQSDALAIADLDPMALARAVDRGGDGPVLDELAEEAPSLAALHATPYLRAPERALPRLAAIAAGRDPWRAPAAMHALLQIARSPVLDGMTRREADPLDETLAILDRLAADASAREDLRGAAALARSQLTLED